jgi:hypothetical protein
MGARVLYQPALTVTLLPTVFVMPTKVGIHGFSRLSRGIVVDGGPSPAMTRYVSVLAGWY